METLLSMTVNKQDDGSLDTALTLQPDLPGEVLVTVLSTLMAAQIFRVGKKETGLNNAEQARFMARLWAKIVSEGLVELLTICRNEEDAESAKALFEAFQSCAEGIVRS